MKCNEMVLGIIRRVVIFLMVNVVFFSGQAQEPAPNHLVLTGQTIKIPFEWKADSINGEWDQHAAMIVPVKLDKCPLQFYMQFDLGATSSLLYKEKLVAISRKYPAAVRVSDSVSLLTDFFFITGKTKILATEIILRKVEEEGVINGVRPVIGTIGTDLVDGRQVLIDYPGKAIWINYFPPDSQSVKMTSLYYSRRSILFPVSIRGNSAILYFDTGSSAFELLASEKTARQLATPNATPIRYKVNSWGRLLTAVSLPTNDSLTIAGVQLPVKKVTYMENVSDTQVSQMMKMGIGGMTGNKLFLGSKLWLDLKNKRFALIEKSE